MFRTALVVASVIFLVLGIFRTASALSLEAEELLLRQRLEQDLLRSLFSYQHPNSLFSDDESEANNYVYFKNYAHPSAHFMPFQQAPVNKIGSALVSDPELATTYSAGKRFDTNELRTPTDRVRRQPTNPLEEYGRVIKRGSWLNGRLKKDFEYGRVIKRNQEAGSLFTDMSTFPMKNKQKYSNLQMPGDFRIMK